ncbi:hypothetical protein MTO96_031422 [Rhipicephalus appendiculatus]
MSCTNVCNQQLLKQAAATLGSGNLHEAVRLPEGIDFHEWIAVHTVDLFNQVSMIYGTVAEHCTEISCAVMLAGPKYEYRWADGQTNKKPMRCSAPEYINCLFSWVQSHLEDEALFPSRVGVPFPGNFLPVVKTILRRLFRVYAHIYHQHFHEVVLMKEEAHLNTSFKHFILFVLEFGLIEQVEMAPLWELIGKAHRPALVP